MEKGGDKVEAYERRLAILQTLCRQGAATATSLAAMYCVSTRTIRADLLALSRSYPVVTKMGRHGGYAMADWFTSADHVLTSSEISLLYRIQQTLQGDDALMMGAIITKVVGKQSLNLSAP